MKSIEHEMYCINLKEPLKHEVELKLLHVVMRENVQVKFVNYDNEEEVMR